MKTKLFAVIMAGGVGSRFWPKSRNDFPKQFLKIIGERTLIQSTVHRIESLIPAQNILIVTNSSHAILAREQLPDIPKENIICEPVGRNTAPCIGLAALIVKQRNSDGIMLVLPADHWIKDSEQFCRELEKAAERAEKSQNLISFGIEPAYPETGYGYIECDNKSNPEAEIFPIKQFREKPDLKQATQFIEKGNFYWNSGTFVWKASIILEEIEKYLPELFNGLIEIEKHLGTSKEQNEINRIYRYLQSESVDYGIMEKTTRAEMIVLRIGWSDVGSWKALEDHLPSDEAGNIVSKKHLLIDTSNSIMESSGRLIAAIGIKDMVVIDSEDVLVLCPKDRCQEIKTLVEKLKKEGRKEYL